MGVFSSLSKSTAQKDRLTTAVQASAPAQTVQTPARQSSGGMFGRISSNLASGKQASNLGSMFSHKSAEISPELQQTTRGTLAKIQQMNSFDPNQAQSAMDMFKQLRYDPSSRYYNPYTQSTNRAINYMRELGMEVPDAPDDKWFEQNAWLKQYYVPTANTNSLSSTMTNKRASTESKLAYYYNQLEMAREDTAKAKAEKERLNNYLTYWATQPDRNYSDEEILGSIDWKQYPTISKMKETAARGTPMELNEAIDVSDDAMYATLWAARNGGGTGNAYQDMINSVTGEGNVWKEDASTAAKRDPSSKDFSIYSLGSTMDKERAHFNRSSFDQQWLDENKHLLQDGTKEDKEGYEAVYKAEQDTQAAETAVTKLWDNVNRWLTNGKYSEKDILNKLDGLLDKDEYSILYKMDDSLNKGFDIINTTRKVDYRKQDVIDYIHKACTKEAEKQSAVDMAGEIYGTKSNPVETVNTSAVGTAVSTPESPQEPELIADALGANDNVYYPQGAIVAYLPSNKNPAGNPAAATTTSAPNISVQSAAATPESPQEPELIADALGANDNVYYPQGAIVAYLPSNKNPAGNPAAATTTSAPNISVQSAAATPAAGFNLDNPPGLIEAGNIDINARPVVQNTDGSFSTEQSITVGYDDGVVVIPTIIAGKSVDDETAIRHYEETGEHLGKFETEAEANQYAEALHERQEAYYGAGAEAPATQAVGAPVRPEAAPALTNKPLNILHKVPEGVTPLTQAELEEMKLKDQNAAAAALALDGKTNSTENAYLTFTSQGINAVQDYLDGTPSEELAGTNTLALCKDYSSQVIDLISTNNTVTRARTTLQKSQDDLAWAQQEREKLEASLFATGEQLDKMNGLRNEGLLDLAYTAKNGNDQEKAEALLDIYRVVSNDFYVEQMREDQAAAQATVWADYLTGTEYLDSSDVADTEARIQELRGLEARSQENAEKAQEVIDKNADAVKTLEERNQWMDETIRAYEEAGIDATDLKAARAVSQYLGGMDSYKPFNWGTVGYYQELHDAGGTPEELKQEHEACHAALANAKWVEDFVEKNGIQLPDAVNERFYACLKDLEANDKDYQYYLLQFNENLKKDAEEGREVEKKTYNLLRDGIAFDFAPREDARQGSWNIALGLDHAFYGQFMTETQKDIFYSLYKQGGEENGRELAWEYYKHLAYDTHILQQKDREQTEANAAAEVNSGALGAVGANVKAVLSSPWEGLSGAAYSLGVLLGPLLEEHYQVNSYDRLLNPARYSAKVQESTLNAIHNEFAEKNPAADKFLSVMYEAAYNNSRSAVNAVVFGGFTNGISNPVTREIVGSFNMGAGAASVAIGDAAEKGATVGQALLIGGITFAAESVSEGLTASNIHEMVTGIRAGNPTSVKAAVVDWLTQNGLEEMAGEVANSAIENWADRSIMGDDSEHAERIESWYQKLKQDNPGTPDALLRQRAEQEAEKDELVGYLHTALVSYISPGMNIVTGMVRSSAERVMDYRRVSNVFQNAGMQDIGISEVREMYKARDAQLNNPGQARAVQPEASTTRIANPGSTPVNPVESGTPVEGDTFVKDASTLNAVAGKSAPVNTAAVTSILYSGKDRQAKGMARAAAVALNRIMGGAEKAVDTVKSVLAGARTAGVKGDAVKTALQIAALSPNSKTAMFLNSDAYQKATPAQRAQILAELGKQDSRNGTVMAEVNGSVQEGIKADFVAAILAEGAGKPAVEAQAKIDEARRKTKRAETVLEEKRADTQKAKEGVKVAEAEVQRNPQNGAPLMKEAISKVASAQTVEDQQAQSVAAQRESEEQVKQTEEQKIDETMTDVRNQAEESFTQMQAEEQQAAKQKAQAKQQALEEQQRLQADEDEASGKASEDRDTESIDSFLDSYGYEGEERETEKQKMLALREQVKYNKFVNSNLNTPEGFMAVSSFSRKLGMQIKLADLGDPRVVRGKYENGVVYLNRNRMRQGDYTVGQAMVEAALHEITHSMEATKSYGAYRGAVLGSLFSAEGTETTDSLYADNAAYRAAIDQKIADYKKVGKELSVPDAEKEIVADFARTRLNDRDTVTRLIDRGLGWKMKSTLHNINEAMKNFYGQLKGEDRTQAEYLRRAERTFQKMMDEAAKQEIHPESSQFSIAQIAQSTGMVFDEKTLELRDSNGNVVDGVNYRITPDMIQQTPVGMLILSGLSDQSPGVDENGNAKPSPQAAAMDMMAGLMNMVARYKDSDLVWEIGASTLSSTFSALKSNSDPQYATTVDFGTVCAKTQAIIDVLSQVMLERVKEGKSGGLTRDEIMKVYDATHNAGLSVPCPVCYVFSRWMGVPSLLGQMSQYQKDFVATNEDGSVNREETQKKVDAYLKNAEKYGDAKAINKRKAKLQSELVKLEEQESAASPEDAKALRNKMVEVKQQLDEVDAYNWITQALCKQDKASGKYTVDPKFQVTPDEILFDLNRTGDFAKYEKNWRYRNTRGAGMGKAIMPYSGETIGDILYGVKARGRQDVLKNPWLNMDPKAAARQLAQARTRAKKQNLVGGQRLQSTSDFRPEWGLDYIMSFLELQAAGSKVQMYTKVPEAVDLFASVGADVNLSIMGKGQGWHVDENGNQVLDFSSITGMDYETAKALKNKYDNVQMILVGMNDTHIRLAMANEDIDFIIPWHSSGNSQDTLKTLIGSLGEKLITGVDYTTTQTDMVKGTVKKYTDENGNKVEYTVPGKQTTEEKDLWDARVKLLTKGGDALTKAERDTLLSNPYTKALYKRFTEKGVDPDCYGVRLNKSQAEQIFPYEYWDTSSTKDTADVNGKRFVEYCEAMGIVPRFSQFKDDPGYWKLLIDRPMYNNDKSYHQQKTIDVTGARIGSLDESGKLTDSDLPKGVKTAKYATNDPRSEHYEEYTEKEKQAKETAMALLDKQYDAGTPAQLSAFGDQTEADRAMLQEAAKDYQDAVGRGDMKAAAEDVESYAASKGYTIKAYHGTPSKFTEFNKWAPNYLTPSEAYAENYGDVMHLYLKPEEVFDPSANDEARSIFNDEFLPYEVQKGRMAQNEADELRLNPGEMFDFTVADDLYSFMKRYNRTHGAKYSTLKFFENGAFVVGEESANIAYIPLDNALIKSADTVTYDDQGNVIPLEERFNDQTGDIRYSAGGDQTEADMALETNFDTMLDDLTTEELNELFGFGEETSEEEARQKLTVAVQDLKNEFDPTIYNGRLYVKPETLNYWLSGQGFASTSPGYAQAYITMMDPSDFLRMTTATEAGQQAVLDSSHTLNDEELGENATRQPIQLRIDESEGKVVGHEGRHRAVALARAGVTQMPVLLFDSATKYSKTAKDSLTLEGQNPYFQDDVENGNTLTFTDVIPLSSGNADTIREQFTASEADRQAAGQNGQRIVQYSSGGEETEADMALSADADRMNNLINMGVLTQQEVDEFTGLSNPDGGRAQRQFGSQTAQESDALHEEVKEYLRNNSGYDPESNKEQLDRAISWVRSQANENDPDGYRAAVEAVTSDSFDYRSADGQAQMLTVMGMAALKNDTDTEMRLADAYNRQGTDLGRALQARKIFRLMTPIGRKAYFQKQVDELNRDIGKKTGKTGTISIDPWLLEAAGAAQNEEDFQKVRKAVAKRIGEQIPANWKDKLRSWRMLAMLGNPRTHIRNVIGNAMFIPAVSIKNKMGAVMEGALSKKFEQPVLKANEIFANDGKARVSFRFTAFNGDEAIGNQEVASIRFSSAPSIEVADMLSEAGWKQRGGKWIPPTTHITANAITELIQKGNAVFMAENGISTTKKFERTKTLTPVLSKEIRDFARQDAIAMRDALTGDAKYNEEDLIGRERRHFKGVFQALSDFNSNALEREDWFFLKGHYRRALGGWIQANGYTVEQLQNDPALLEKGRAYAIQEAQKATYRDFNGLAKKLNDLTRNPETTGQKVLAFGVEAVLPFKKTPANILKRGIEYSPVGIARSIVDAATGLRQYNRYMRGELNTLPENAKSPNEVIDEFCAGLTGTAILAMGAWLGSLGAVSCGFDDDDDEFERLKGGQEYAINPGKAGNAILGIFGVPKLFGEDVTFTLDWAAPMCMPFFVGAAVQEQAVNQEGFSIDELINAFGNITEPVFNLSMLDGVNSLLDMFVAGDDPNTTLTQLGAKVASNYVTSYYPSVFGAAARTFFDDTRRKAFVESGKGSGILGTFRYALEQTQNKIPVWSRDNIPYRDVWGNPEKSGLLERILENFVLPGYINQYKDDPIVNELAQVGRVPKEPPKTFTANNTKYVLTDKQWDAYKTARGQTAYNQLGELMNTPEYQSASLEERGTLIDGIWDYANKVGKETVFPELRDEESEPDTSPVQSILDKQEKKKSDKRVKDNKARMIKALDDNDLEGFGAMVQALRDDGVSDKSIKDKIGDTYRDKYKAAYRSGDATKMDEIADLLKRTDFDFDLESWEKAVDREDET